LFPFIAADGADDRQMIKAALAESRMPWGHPQY
jgi:hypothetical protein